MSPLFKLTAPFLLLSLISVEDLRAQRVDQLAPESGAPGATITVTGSGFGQRKGKAYLLPAGGGKKIRLKTLWWEDRDLQLLLPSRRLKADFYTLGIRRRGSRRIVGTSGIFEIAAPTIQSVDESAVCLGFLAIDGEFLGALTKVKVDGRRSRVIFSRSLGNSPDGDPSARIIIKLPKRVRGTLHQVVVDNRAGKAATAIAYDRRRRAGSPKLNITAGNRSFSFRNPALFGLFDMRLNVSRLMVSGSRGNKLFAMDIPAFGPCNLTEYLLDGSGSLGGFMVGGGIHDAWATIPGSGAGLKVTITHIGGGQIAGRLSGTLLHIVNGGSGTLVPAEGSFIVDIVAVSG